MDGERPKIQRELAFPPNVKGEALRAGRKGAEPPVAAGDSETPAKTDRLIEEVCERENLKKALKQVQANKGSPGIDRMTVAKLPDFLRKHWPALRDQLLRGTYQPQPVKRVEIPKPDGGMRKLGIPTVLDRFIQQAVMQVLQKQWDPTFSQHSYGFRPKRSAHQAVAQAQKNLVLDDLDRELAKRGHRFVRYADDCNIYVRSRAAGDRVMESVTAFLTKRLKLKVNREKSAVARPWERKFLGFSFTNGREPRRRIAPKALQRFKDRIRELTRRTRGVSLEQRVKEMAAYLNGWRAYFGYCQTPSGLQRLDEWIGRRLRCATWKQWKRGPKRFAELRQRRIRKDLAAKTAGSPHGPWRLANSPGLNIALPNPYFISLGLPKLNVRPA